MTTQEQRERLRVLIDTLPESEVDTAEHVLTALALAVPAYHSLDDAPIDDEPETEAERMAVAEARAQQSVPHVEARRQLLGS